MDWTRIRHFRKSEFGKDPDRADPELVLALDRLREYAGVPVHLHVCWDGSGHAPASLHKKGRAADFHFGGELSKAEQFVAVSALDFGGVGFYPHWNFPGWHVDLRPGRPRLFWVRDREGRYHYGKEALARAIR